MIRFSCLHCGMKYQLKDEFAGRQTHCRSCRQPLTVPAPLAVPVEAPPRLEGPQSCLHQVGHAGGVCLEQTMATQARPAAHEPTLDHAHKAVQRPVREVLSQGAASGQRYLVEGELGRGGMGLVLRAIDSDIRREVAVKYLLDPGDPRKKSRFIEEAQITGQLEHPNIVPVHELSIDGQRRLFFTMKMVRGRSLDQVLDELLRNPAAAREYTLVRLLSVLVSVCNALAYAHSRGVVHRDLKPGNIMLGDFGEVYVMDWGLAKVLSQDVQTAPVATVAAAATAAPQTVPDALPAASRSGSGSLTAKVVTSRDTEADLTQEGSVLGTPAYMPPEQAQGRIAAVDQRSDVYALGAILYEMLTLSPPVSKQGGYTEVLVRVIEGAIVPPEQMQRGRVPRELSAVAMKALAKDPAQRYPTAEAFRRDIELFLEGRSVSAKTDSVWEQAVKFVKRNRGFSGATAAAMVLIAVILWFSFSANYQARVRAEEAYNGLREEQEARRQQGRHSAPFFLRDARASLEHQELDYALAQVNAALEYDPDFNEARLLKGELLAARLDFAQARTVLSEYLERKPEDSLAMQLADLCQKADRDDTERMRAISELFFQHKEIDLAASMLRRKDELFALYRKQLERAWKTEWPQVTAALTMDPDGKIDLNLAGRSALVTDLLPLRGMRLSSLCLRSCKKVKDLSPLRNMPLTALDIAGTEVEDLTPLQGMKLTNLDLRSSRVKSLQPLAGMPLTSLLLSSSEINDLAALRDMPLTHLALEHMPGIKDLSPLRGLPLTSLRLHNVLGISDLTPLKELKLAELDLQKCSVQDLTPLKGMPLSKLSLGYLPLLRDLTPLQDMPLTELVLRHCPQIKNLTPLQRFKLKGLSLSGSPIRDLTPLNGMLLEWLDLRDCSEVKDLTPLEGMPLKELVLDSTRYMGMEVVRKLTSLRSINSMPADRFWERYDAKKP
jgi:serine/threonine protein kinase/Leucine-rich repeat (LRR) protein